jgi:hypothetical protein
LEVSIDFSQKQLANAKLGAFGKFIGQREIVLGGSEGRTTEYEMLQPEVQEGRVFFLGYRALGFHVASKIGTPVSALFLRGEFEWHLWQHESRGAGG